MTLFNIPLKTGMIALSPYSLESGWLGLGITIAQLPRMLWNRGASPLVHAAPVWVVYEHTSLPGTGELLCPEAYTVDAVGGGLVATRIDAQLLAKRTLVIRDVPEEVRANAPSGQLGIEKRMSEWHIHNIGRLRYDVRRLFGFLFRIPFNWTPCREKPGRVLKSTVCSAYTAISARHAFAFDVVPEYADFWTSPSDLGRSQELVTLTHELKLVRSIGP